jgi:hypothetical protein
MGIFAVAAVQLELNSDDNLARLREEGRDKTFLPLPNGATYYLQRCLRIPPSTAITQINTLVHYCR